MKVRLIIQSNENGSKESVIFTDELDIPAEDFVIPGCSIDYNEIIEADLPTIFPLSESLKREW